MKEARGLSLRDIINVLKREHARVDSSDNIDISEHLVVPDEVVVDGAKISNQHNYDEPYIDFDFKVSGGSLFQDRNFLRTLYEDCSGRANETEIGGSFSLDEFVEAKIPIQSISSLSTRKHGNILKQGTPDAREILANDTIEFRYSTWDARGPVIEVKTSRLFGVEMRKMRQELRLNMFYIAFNEEDYVKMKCLFPDKFTEDFVDWETLKEVPMSGDELKAAEEHLGKDITPDRPPIIQISVGNLPERQSETYVKAYYRNVDAKSDPNLAYSLVKRGLELVDQAQIHVGSMEEGGDFDIRLNEGKVVINYEQVPSPISYTTDSFWAEVLPVSSFPIAGHIRDVRGSTIVKHDKAGPRGTITNTFSLSDEQLDSTPYQHILMRVSLKYPLLYEAQQKLLDEVGVSFR